MSIEAARVQNISDLRDKLSREANIVSLDIRRSVENASIVHWSYADVVNAIQELCKNSRHCDKLLKHSGVSMDALTLNSKIDQEKDRLLYVSIEKKASKIKEVLLEIRRGLVTDRSVSLDMITTFDAIMDFRPSQQNPVEGSVAISNFMSKIFQFMRDISNTKHKDEFVKQIREKVFPNIADSGRDGTIFNEEQAVLYVWMMANYAHDLISKAKDMEKDMYAPYSALSSGSNAYNGAPQRLLADMIASGCAVEDTETLAYASQFGEPTRTFYETLKKLNSAIDICIALEMAGKNECDIMLWEDSIEIYSEKYLNILEDVLWSLVEEEKVTLGITDDDDDTPIQPEP